MKVDSEQVRQNREYLKKLIKGQRGEIASREQEIENLKKISQKAIENERLQGEVQLMDIQDRNQARIIEESQGNEGKLEELKKQVIDEQKRLYNEELALKKVHKGKIENMNRNHSIKTRDIFERAQDEVKELNYNVNEQIKDVEKDTTTNLSAIRHDSKLKIDKAEYENALKVTSAQDGAANQMKRMEERLQTAMRQQELDHKNKVNEQTLKNNSDFLTRKRIHEDRTKSMEKHYSELAKGEKTAFEEKYQNMIKEHKSVLDRLSLAFDAEFNKNVESFSKKMETAETRYADKFYHLKTIEPNLREDEKFYYIDIKTPPHEKENYHLTAHDRKIKLSFNRRSEERMDKNGEVQTSNKSETITREFKVANIVKDKELRQSYKDGILSYRLPKA